MKTQEKEIIYLWENKTALQSESDEKTLQVTENVGVITKVVEVKNPSLTVFKPKQNSNGVGIIICPGGGYSILAIDLEGFEIAEWLTDLGYTAFVLKYSVPNKKIEALNDLQRALKIVRNNTEKYALDIQKIGILGFSAGGSLCARASTLYNEETYVKKDKIDTLSSGPDFTLLIYPAYLDEGKNSTITPELKINTNTPPMFIFGTADDVYGNSSLVMAQALRDSKVPVDLHFLSKGGHGYGLRKGNIAAETWPDLAKTWLKKINSKINLK